jgi:hypothetical protein
VRIRYERGVGCNPRNAPETDLGPALIPLTLRAPLKTQANARACDHTQDTDTESHHAHTPLLTRGIERQRHPEDTETHLQTRQSRVEAASHSSSTPFSCATLFRCCCTRSRSALRLSCVRFISYVQRSHIFRGSEHSTSKPAGVGVRVRVK